MLEAASRLMLNLHQVMVAPLKGSRGPSGAWGLCFRGDSPRGVPSVTSHGEISEEFPPYILTANLLNDTDNLTTCHHLTS